MLWIQNFNPVSHGTKKHPQSINNQIVNLRNYWLCLTILQMNSWTLSVQDLGSRSWTLETLMVSCLWKSNCYSILWLFDFPMFVVQGSHFLMICLDSVYCDGDMTGRESPDWGRSVKVSWYDASVFIYEGHIFSFELEKVRCGPSIWVVNQLMWDPKILFIKRYRNESRVPFLRITSAMTVSTWTYCTDKKCSCGDRVMFPLMYWVRVLTQTEFHHLKVNTFF